MPIRIKGKKVRYRFKQVSPKKRVRLAYVNNDVVEITEYTKKNSQYIKGHIRRIRRR